MDRRPDLCVSHRDVGAAGYVCCCKTGATVKGSCHTNCFYSARWLLLIPSDKAGSCTESHSYTYTHPHNAQTTLSSSFPYSLDYVCLRCLSEIFHFICHPTLLILRSRFPFYLWYETIKKSCFFSVSFPLLCPLCVSAWWHLSPALVSKTDKIKHTLWNCRLLQV